MFQVKKKKWNKNHISEREEKEKNNAETALLLKWHLFKQYL